MKSTAEDEDGLILRRLTILVGCLAIIFFVFIVTASSYQKEKVKILARRLLRTKKLKVHDDNIVAGNGNDHHNMQHTQQSHSMSMSLSNSANANKVF
jgi:FtsZ-interacting cell division protein ZipA